MGAAGEPGAESARRVEHAAAVEHAAPAARHRELGKRLRSLRTETGMSIEDVAGKLLWPTSKVRELEAAANLPSETDLRGLRVLFKLDDATADELAELAREAKRQGWWIEYQGVGAPYIRLEQNASSITSYTMHYFPALLQTEDYARAIVRIIDPTIGTKALEDRVKARLRRQRVLDTSSNLRYAVLMDEAVLHRPTGGRAVICKQLDKVLKVIQTHKVDLRIIPLDSDTGVAQDSNFVLLQFSGPDLLPVVYLEGLAAYKLLDGKRDVDLYLEEIKRLKESALGFDDSADLVEQIRDTYRDT